MGEQFTDLAGGAIGDLFGGIKGTLIGKGINAGVHKMIDIFMSNTGKKGFIVAEVQDGEALQMPAGSHDVLFSFGGVLDRAIERNIPVNPNLTTTVNIAPGEVKLCKYSYQDLGTLGGGSAYATSINSSGQVVGGSYTSTGSYHAFLWAPSSGMQDLGTLGAYSIAYGINASGQVVGVTEIANGSYHPFLKNLGQPMEDLGILGTAFAINDSGQVVGEAASGAFTGAFLKNPGQPIQDLETGWGSRPYSINASGQVVGITHTGSGQAFLKSPGQSVENLGAMGGDTSTAFAINDSGQIVGSAHFPFDNSHAFLKNPGYPMQDLGDHSVVYGINASGQVVGFTNATAAAFLWTRSEGWKNLNALTIDLPQGVFLAQANAINDAGQVVGVTSNNSAFLLTPIP